MKKLLESFKKPEALLSLAGIVALVALFSIWRLGHSDTSSAGVAAAMISAALFAGFGVSFVFAWMEEWSAVREQGPVSVIREPVRWTVLLRIFLTCLAAEAGALLLVYLLRIVGGYRGSFRDSFAIWEMLDSQHYLDIARDWYLSDAGIDRVVQLVFLPGYPLMIRLFHLLIRNWTAAAFAVSILSFSFGGVMLYLLARLDADHYGALRALKYTLILPGAFFFAAPMSEGLFFLLSVSCLYCIRTEKWLPAGILGAMASFTRSLGIVLLVPGVYAWVTDMIAGREKGGLPVKRRVLQMLCLCVIPLGFGAYCLVSKSVSGDAFKFLEYQKNHWNQSAGLFFHTASYQTENALRRWEEGNWNLLLGLWLPNLICSFGALAVMIPAARKLRPVYSVYFMAYYVIAIGTTWLLSAPRYLVACVTLGLGLSSVTEDRRTDDAMTVVIMVGYVLYSYFMAMRWQVW